jgi:adenylate cyclase
MALIVAVGGTVVALLVLGGLLLGSPVPPIILAVPVTFFAWYLGIRLLLTAGLFRPWMRYASSLVDVSLGSVVTLLDMHANGALYTLSAAGPAFYAVGVAMATLRLQPGLCLFAGLAAAAQLVAVMVLVVRPGLSPELLASGVGNLTVVFGKAIFLVTLGVLGMVTSRSMRWMLLRLTESAIERERVRGVLGMHVSEQVMEHLLSGQVPNSVERRAITVCFTDIRDFTRLSESQPAEETVRLLNLYYGRMCEIVAAHGGLVNKFLGDGMLIVFGAPTYQPDDAQRALAAAREMLAEATRMRERGEFPGLHIGVGLHRGEAVVGNVGGAQRQEYTAIGDTVNTASRVQDLTKALGHSLLITRECRDGVSDCVFEPLGTHSVKGRLQPLELFTPRESVAQQAA